LTARGPRAAGAPGRTARVVAEPPTSPRSRSRFAWPSRISRTGAIVLVIAGVAIVEFLAVLGAPPNRPPTGARATAAGEAAVPITPAASKAVETFDALRIDSINQ